MLSLTGLAFCFVSVWLHPQSHRGGLRGGLWVAVFSIFAIYVFSKEGVLGFYIFDVSTLRVVLGGVMLKTLGVVFFQTLPPTKNIRIFFKQQAQGWVRVTCETTQP
jgi:hypothetical protein